MELNVCFDLGSDTLKVVFSYNYCGNVHYGKVVKNTFDDTAFPGTAFYDEIKKKWLFANDIDESGVESFTTVIKIKKLLGLLKRLDSKSSKIEEQNKNYYFKEHHFPKFYFPNRIKLTNENNFSEKVKKEMTFICLNKTPQMICEDYFRYIKVSVDKKIKEISQKVGLLITSINYGIIYPPNVGITYINEIKRLVETVFATPKIAISSTKAISMFAYHLGLFKENEPILIFDMGEEKIQVAKAKLVKQGDFNGVAVDSIEGHLDPLELGGDDVDKAIVDFLEGTVEQRETMGSPSYGNIGHIIERGVHSKQYLLMKSVKQAKTIISDPSSKTNIFKDGVPVTMYRDVVVQNTLTENNLLDCIGINNKKNKSSIVNKIVDYIAKEINLKINSDSSKVLLSGGLIETVGLFDYIKQELSKKVKKKVSVFVLEASKEEGEDQINIYEDSVYSAALGGVMVMQMGYKMKMISTRSYAVNIVARTLQKRCLGIFVDKGTLFDEDEYLKSGYFTNGSEIIIEIYSIDITNKEIELNCKKLIEEYNRSIYKSTFNYIRYDYYNQDYRKSEYPLVYGYIIQKNKEAYYFERYSIGRNQYDEYRLMVGADNDSYRTSIMKAEDLKFKVLSGGRGNNLYFYYKNKRVRFVNFGNGRIFYFIGVRFDEEGRGFPEARNDIVNNGNAKATIMYDSGATEIVYLKNIEPRMPKLAAIENSSDG